MRTGGVESEANVTDIHEALHFDLLDDSHTQQMRHSFGIWSLQWAADGREVIAGTNDHALYIFDMERQKVASENMIDAMSCLVIMA
jgi:WD repeat-containing protein 23